MMINTKLNINNIAKMQVLKRGSRGYQEVKFDKITARIKNLCAGLNEIVDPVKIAAATINNLYDGIPTTELDAISSNIADSFKLIHPDYSILAAKILVSNLHKNTPNSFTECARNMHGVHLISDAHYAFIERNGAALDAMIIHENDYRFDYFGYKTLEGAYLGKINVKDVDANGNQIYIDDEGVIVPFSDVRYVHRKPTAIRKGKEVVLTPRQVPVVIDRPQYMYMRVAVALYMNDDVTAETLEQIRGCYEGLSYMYFTHATPTLFNSCARVQQLLSCFLLATEDSIEAIMKTVTDASLISKRSGGIGIYQHVIRPAGSHIAGTNGKALGLVPQMKIYNDVAQAWNQGGRRRGVIAQYLEPWHGDIMKFLCLKLNQGADELRARDLYYAMWIPDLFMRRWFADAHWSLFDNNVTPGLHALYDGMPVCTKCGFCDNIDYIELVDTRSHSLPIFRGVLPISDDLRRDCAACDHHYESKNMFTMLYERYESEGLAIKTIKANDIVEYIFDSIRESGLPYILYKDHVNRQSNQQNIGTIKSSNLCAEIVEWSGPKSYACCCLGSINLRAYVKPSGYDYAALHQYVRMVARNLDIIIDRNDYPVPECTTNSQSYRPIGIGVQGLANAFAAMDLPFLSEGAERMDIAISETIYHAALTESCARARDLGAYSRFAGSPASRGVLRFDMWSDNQLLMGNDSTVRFSGMYDWDALKNDIRRYGLRNSLHVAYMPTVSTSQIMGNNESFEPFSSNVYTKNTDKGKYTIANDMLVRDLIDAGLWNENIKNRIINNDGMLEGMTDIPERIRTLYMTVWEMKQTNIMYRAALRSAFIDQSQSLNIHLRDNSNKTLRGMMIMGWKYGLTTGSYYVRTKAATKAMSNNITVMKAPVCSRDDPTCESCSG